MATRPLPSVLVALGPSASAEPDAELLARYVATQDDAAFALLVRRYARLVWRVARTRCRIHATAEDVFQATFVVLARKADSIRTAGALPGWLHRTAHRLAVKATRGERSTSPLPTDTPVSADPLDAMTARELLAAVDDELAKLSDAERSVLVLCGIDHTSLEDAAARLGWSVGSAKGRLGRARAKLRSRLDARGLALPAVVLGLIGGPSAATVQAAMSPGRAVSPVIEHLISEAFSMKTTCAKAALAAGILGGLLFVGGWSITPNPTGVAIAAPVPKDKSKLVVWSEAVMVDWKASRAERLAGVWLPDGKGVLVSSADGVDLRDVDTGKVTKTLTAAKVLREDAFLPQSLAVSPDGKSVYASGSLFTPGGQGQAVRVRVTWWDWDKPDNPDTAIRAVPPEDPIALSADGKQLASFSSKEVTVFAAATGRTHWISKLGDNGGRPNAIAFHPTDGSLLVAGTGGGCLTLDAKTGRTLLSITKLGLDVRSVAVSADGKVTAFGGTAIGKGSALVLVGKDVTADAVPEKEAINGLALSPDGKHLATACTDGLVRVFDAATGKLVASAKEHKEAVFSVAYSPDGKKLLTVGKDAVKVWEVERLMKAK